MGQETHTVEIPVFGVGPHNLVIAQGFHGPYHSLDPSPMRLDYAVDLAVPDGSIVVAARDGIVKSLLTGSMDYCDRWDLTPDEITRLTRYTANWILLQHGDGVESLYSHLSKGGALVSRGQSVKALQPIGYTGKTGWVPFPHLHFQLHRWIYPKQSDGIGRNETIPICFSGYNGPMEHLEIFPSGYSFRDTLIHCTSGKS